MSIYDRALGPQRYMRQQSTGLLNLASQPPGADRPPLPQVNVGEAEYERYVMKDREAERAQQAQIYGGIANLLQTASQFRRDSQGQPAPAEAGVSPIFSGEQGFGANFGQRPYNFGDTFGNQQPFDFGYQPQSLMGGG